MKIHVQLFFFLKFPRVCLGVWLYSTSIDKINEEIKKTDRIQKSRWGKNNKDEFFIDLGKVITGEERMAFVISLPIACVLENITEN